MDKASAVVHPDGRAAVDGDHPKIRVQEVALGYTHQAEGPGHDARAVEDIRKRDRTVSKQRKVRRLADCADLDAEHGEGLPMFLPRLLQRPKLLDARDAPWRPEHDDRRRAPKVGGTVRSAGFGLRERECRCPKPNTSVFVVGGRHDPGKQSKEREDDQHAERGQLVVGCQPATTKPAPVILAGCRWHEAERGRGWLGRRVGALRATAAAACPTVVARPTTACADRFQLARLPATARLAKRVEAGPKGQVKPAAGVGAASAVGSDQLRRLGSYVGPWELRPPLPLRLSAFGAGPALPPRRCPPSRRRA